MPVIAVIGAQWGDEGKGKIVDLLSQQVNAVVRFSGGDNAGHTVINQYGEFKLHLVPSGIFNPKSISFLGNGMVINPAVLLTEIEQLNQRGVDTSRLFISDRAHLVMPYHIMLDALEEESLAGKALGTTRKGIGPAFVDKAARLGIRMGDLLDTKVLWERLSIVIERKNIILTRVYGAKPIALDEIFEQYRGYGERLAPYIRETGALLEKMLLRGDAVLLEGAQGTLLDPDFGTYPYTTSSSPLAAGGAQGSGIAPTHLTTVLGVFKAYSTRVGNGPMPTELRDATGDRIREIAHEYGTTTGRPRRCGWFDGVAGRFSNRINGYTGAVVTRLDVLDVLPVIKICIGYERQGQRLETLPSSAAILAQCGPIYEEMPGWETPTSGIRSFENLPEAAQRYIEKIEGVIKCPVDIVSVGAGREQTITRRPLL
jgi:adenylosuccinate synthase